MLSARDIYRVEQRASSAFEMVIRCDVELDIIFPAFRTDLNAEPPRGKDSLVNGTVQISAVEIRILTSDFSGPRPRQENAL